MSTTKYRLAEQVMLRLKGGRPDMATKVDMRDLILAVGQAANEELKGQMYKTVLPNGETIPDGLMLATFEDVPVEQWKTISRSVLPVIPVQLPRGMGIFRISDPDNPHIRIIPTLPGQIAQAQTQRLIADFGGMHVYEPYGSYVEYDKNLLSVGINRVMMRLVVRDVDSLTDHDPLPIPADYEATIVDRVFTRFAEMGTADKKTDVQTENK